LLEVRVDEPWNCNLALEMFGLELANCEVDIRTAGLTVARDEVDNPRVLWAAVRMVVYWPEVTCMGWMERIPAKG